MKKGEVWFVEFPEGKGFEQHGARPALVLGGADNLIVAMPFTTNTDRINLSFTRLFEPSKENGLNQPSVLLIHNITALDETRFKKKLGWISIEERNVVGELLKTMLKL